MADRVQSDFAPLAEINCSRYLMFIIKSALGGWGEAYSVTKHRNVIQNFPSVENLAKVQATVLVRAC
jgi:hypothetical protein